MQHTVNVPNKVSKHRQQLLSQCISNELYLFSSKYFCKQKLHSKPKSEYEKKGTADSGNWRSRHMKYLTGLHSSLQGHAIPSVTSEKQNSKAKVVLSLYLPLFFQIHRDKLTSFLKERTENTLLALLL